MSVGKTVRWKTKDGSRRGQHQTREHTEWAVVVGQIGRTFAPAKPLEGPVSMILRFWMPKPKSAPKRVVLPLTRPDLDNLIHKLSDQFNGVLWADDAQLVDWIQRKRYVDDNGRGEPPGLEVTVVEGPLTMLVVGEAGVLVQDD